MWAFGQVLAGVVAITIPIRYGTSKFRDDIVNQVCQSTRITKLK